MLQAITHPDKRAQRFVVFATACRRIGETPVDADCPAWKQWAGVGCVIANGYDVVKIFFLVHTEMVRSLTGNIDSTPAHCFNRKVIDA